MSKRPKRNSESLTERTNRNEREFFVWHVDPACAGSGQSPLAIDIGRRCCRLAYANSAPEPRPSPLWSLAGGIDEVPPSLLFAHDPGRTTRLPAALDPAAPSDR